jgi:hypothetical protein
MDEMQRVGAPFICTHRVRLTRSCGGDVLVFVVLLIKSDDPVFKLDCPVLADLAYVSPNFNRCDPPVMCIT